MAVRLVVTKWVADETHSLDCMLCNETGASAAFTVALFCESETGNTIPLCPEHLDQVVTAALARHIIALKNHNPHWYLNEDIDPWEGMDT